MFQQKWLHYVLRFLGLCIFVCVIGLLIFFKSPMFTQIGLTRGSDSDFQFLPFIVQLMGTPSPPPTNTPTPTVTITSTPTPSITPTPTSSPTPTVTPSPTSTSTPTSTPIFSCPTPEVSSHFEAEDFFCGGEGVAYHDNDPVNQGGQYRLDEGVDLAVAIDPWSGNSYYVGWTESGEWLTYSFIVLYPSYPLSFYFRVSSPISTARFHIEIDGIDVTGSILLPDTGNIQNWEHIGPVAPITPLLLQPGVHTARLVIEEGGGNYNHMDIGLATPIPTPGRP